MNVAGSYVYDKAKYHDDTVANFGLPEEHASNHTIFFLRWLMDNDLVSDFFVSESGDILARYRAGNASIYDVYEWWDRVLLSEMLSEEGNAFAMSYFDFERGKYISDYKKALKGRLPSEFHVQYNEENYEQMRKVIDRRFAEWKTPKRKWWTF